MFQTTNDALPCASITSSIHKRENVPLRAPCNAKSYLLVVCLSNSQDFRSGIVVAHREFKPVLSPSAPLGKEQAVMKRTRIKDPFHNPFHNRFHVPVHSRLDEMQAYTHMVWLNDPLPDRDAETRDPATRRRGDAETRGRGDAGTL